jgi:hypothetical protein
MNRLSRSRLDTFGGWCLGITTCVHGRDQMGLTRRAFLGGVIGAAGAGALAGLDPFPARRALALPAPSAAGTTLEQVIVRGAAGAGGYAALVAGPGEPYLRRTDLGGLRAGGGDSRVLACFA